MNDAIIDRELLLRGAFIALLDIVLFSLIGGKPVLQVLYAIGISMMLMVYLQRLGAGAVFWLAVLVIAGGEFRWHCCGNRAATCRFGSRSRSHRISARLTPCSTLLCRGSA